MPRAAAAVWRDGAEPCLAQSLPADGGGSRLPLRGRAGTVPPCSARAAPGDQLGIQAPSPNAVYLARFPDLYCSGISSVFNRNLLTL